MWTVALLLIIAVVSGCSAGPTTDRGDYCLCAADVAPDTVTAFDTFTTFDVADAIETAPATDGGCDDRHVLVYRTAGCGGTVAPTCVDRTDTACLTTVCGCDGIVHFDDCEGSSVPWAYAWGSPGGEGTACSLTDASPGG